MSAVADLLRSAPFRWWVAGGWAIDLFIGRATREHFDLEVSVLRRDLGDVQRWLAPWELWYVPAPGKLALWQPDVPLAPDVHQVWCRPSANAPWALELLVEEATADKWLYRRDRRIARPLASIGLEISGVPVLRPEIVLLYKSKGSRERDEADLRSVIPSMDRAARQWLSATLRAVGTGDRWLPLLE